MFKGGEAAFSSRGKKKEKMKRKREKALERAEAEGYGVQPGPGGASSVVERGTADECAEQELRPIQGTGRITSSSTTVHGHETKFMDELHAGDAVIITHPST